VFALAEEVALFPGASEPRKRMLALFQISEADDLGMALWRLFMPGNSGSDRLSSGRCFARYTVIEDSAQRAVANKLFQEWMQQSAETVCGADAPVRETQASTSLALEVEVQHRELEEVAFSLGPLASGF
jgi:hypothetical protein